MILLEILVEILGQALNTPMRHFQLSQ